MSENPTLRTHLMSLTELFDEPQHLHGPDAQRCSAADHPEVWAELTVGWSQVVGAARTLQQRHVSDSKDPVLSMCADSARESAVGELRWCWARLVNKYVEGIGSDA
ncbi:hypothetical protein [Mycobacteroides abscessus]|uniref:hypothetical protein n=1 Tax=Mycobacteroides abscessus TaxID=36809 RepID=UPI0009C8885A|nr:hypothetical protein [Mycobacteroides abscessus]MDM3948262.1 hypothetical protein [Mycobacteroides abscessus]SLI38644.1 Uncharacterised protein [Mycobacteroides abscessus subsp. massiliense]